MSDYNPIISMYHVMDDGKGNVWAYQKLKDLTFRELVNVLNDYMNKLDQEDQYIIHADDETTLIKGLEERQWRLEDLGDKYMSSYELTIDNLFTYSIDNIGEQEKLFEYDFELIGNNIDGLVLYIDGREIYRTFSTHYEIHLPE